MAAIVSPRKTSSDASRLLVLDELVTWILRDGKRHIGRGGPREDLIRAGEPVEEPRRHVHLRLIPVQGRPLESDLRRRQRDVDPSGRPAVEVFRKRERW